MEKYRLKQWYPNLHLAWSTTDNYEYDRKGNRMYNRTRWGTISITAPYLHPDFWELIEEKESLFITDDGIKVFDMDTIVHIVRNNASARIKISAAYVSKYDLEHKVFFHESNADEYIWKNKRLFSYKDIEKYQSGGESVWYDVKAIAKRRSKE